VIRSSQYLWQRDPTDVGLKEEKLEGAV